MPNLKEVQLQEAAFYGVSTKVRRLLQQKVVDINCIFKVIHTLMHSISCVFVCLQDGTTALHLAAQEGKVDVVRLLTEAQALVNIQTQVCTSTTLHMSCLMNGLLCFNK